MEYRELPKESKANVTKIRKLFLSPDHGSVQQGVEIARTLGDPDVFRYFLDGVEYCDKGFEETASFRYNLR